ncbi:MAG: putative MPP superfamily phosphohydrolase [Gammaproteobacteria bacterium]|jgi:predicted MPP superfamily phosphohydrolase
MLRPFGFLAFYYLMFGYPWWRLTSMLLPAFQWGSIELAALLVSPAALFIGSRRLPSPLRHWSARLVYLWLGASWILMCLSLPWELVYLLAPLDARLSGLALLALFTAITSFACVNANRLRVVTVRLSSPKITKPIRALQLSDVHVGSRSPAFLARVVKASNALAPDVVFITGDLIDGQGVKRTDLAPLGTIKAPAFFVIGNHERYVDCDEICIKLRNLGLHVLRNQSEQVRVNGVDLCVSGIDDADDPAQVGDVLATNEALWEFCSRAYSILLYHRPDGLEDAAQAGFDLMLCGHTHNGQLVPFNALVKRRFPRIKGLYRHGSTSLYVSVGTGTWGPPMRLGSVNELTILELVQQDPADTRLLVDESSRR